MLDCLPVELLQHILRLAAPLDYSPELYKERRSTLRSCCLVNRTMRELAQPMLPEVFVVDREEEIQELEGDARGFRVKNLVFKRVKRGVVDFNTIAMDSVARLCPNIVDLKLFQPDAFDLEPVSSLPHLRSLVVAGGTRLLPFSNPSFPHLIELSLCGAFVDDPFLNNLLLSSATPALKALGIATLDGPDEAQWRSLPVFASGELDRVDVLSLDTLDGPFNTLPIFRFAGLLLDVHLHHLPTFLATLDGVDLPSGLRVYLDSSQDPQEKTMASFIEHFDTGLQICATRGIEVAFPDNAQDWHHDSLVSPWFWRRMGRIKEEEGEQPGQAVGSG
ncbi:hypothetical protein JCM10213_008687 [Rhodosporidiobolus nylandii]